MQEHESGRSTQPDPIGLAGGLNLYGYAGGDPVNFSDPFGLFRLEGAAAQQFVRDLQSGVRTVASVFAALEERDEWEATMKKSDLWRGCRQKSFSFPDTDKLGRASEWSLRQVRVMQSPRLKIRGIPVPGVRIGIYAGTFQSASYPAPLVAHGYVFCAAGVGIFGAAGFIP